MRKTQIIVGLFALPLLLAACNRAAPPPAAQPAATAAAAPRVISTVPAATLNLVLIGAADRLVGVSKYDRPILPEGFKDLPVVGDYETLNYEELLGLKPTALVIQTETSRIAPRLRDTAAEHHIELINMKFDAIADIWPSVRALGKVAGREAAAEAAIAEAQADLKDLKLLYAAPPHPKVLYIMSTDLMMVAGKNSFVDEMITLAGGENLGAIVGPNYPDINREAVINLAPDVLLIGALEETGMQLTDPRLKAWVNIPVPATRNHRVYLVTDGNALMASVDVAKNVRTLADLIHQGDPPVATLVPPTQPASGPATVPEGARP